MASRHIAMPAGRRRPVMRAIRQLVLPSAVSLALLVGCSSVAPTASPAPSPTEPAPSPTASSSAAATAVPSAPSILPSVAPSAPATAGWQKVWPGAGAPNRTLAAIVALDAGYVVTGVDRVTLAPAAMASPDGVTWADEAITGKDVYPSSLAAWGDRVVAAGAGQVPCAHPFGLDTWIRSAAGAWTEAPFNDLFCRGSDVDIAIVDGRPILAGSGPGDSADAWSSTDGLRWVDRSRVFSGVLPRALAGDGSSAVIFAQSSSGTWVSTSADGSQWSVPAMIPGLPADLVIEGAFWIDGAPTLVVTEGDVVGSIRPDGQGGWQRSQAEGIAAGELGSVTAFDGGMLAVTADATVRAWVSREGLSWRPLTLPEDLSAAGANVAAVAVRGDRAVLIGSLPDAGGDPVSVIWTGPASLVLP
jgi:hypothetical protein